MSRDLRRLDLFFLMTPSLAALSRAWKALLINDLAFSASFEARAFLISLIAAL